MLFIHPLPLHQDSLQLVLPNLKVMVSILLYCCFFIILKFMLLFLLLILKPLWVLLKNLEMVDYEMIEPRHLE